MPFLCPDQNDASIKFDMVRCDVLPAFIVGLIPRPDQRCCNPLNERLSATSKTTLFVGQVFRRRHHGGKPERVGSQLPGQSA